MTERLQVSQLESVITHEFVAHVTGFLTQEESSPNKHDSKLWASARDWKNSGVEDAAKKVVDRSLKMCGMPKVEHVFLYSVSSVDNEVRRGYLQKAYGLGKEFQ